MKQHVAFKKTIHNKDGIILELLNNKRVLVIPTTSYFYGGHMIIETLNTIYYK